MIYTVKHQAYPQYFAYITTPMSITPVNAAMYAKLKYTPWLDYPPGKMHQLQDWLKIYNQVKAET